MRDFVGPRRAGVLAALVLCLGFPTHLLAEQNQDEPARSFVELSRKVRSGDRVQVHDRSGRTYEGSLAVISAEEGTLILKESDGGMAFKESDVHQVALGTAYTKSFALEGTLLGAAAGWGVGAALVAASCGQPDCGGADYALAYGAVLAPIGALVGLFAGRHIERPRTRWDVVFSNSHRQAGFFPIITGDKKGAGFWLSF